MAHKLYSGFAIHNIFMSSVVLINEVLQRHSFLSAILLTYVPLDFCTTADFEIQHFFNDGSADVLGNT